MWRVLFLAAWQQGILLYDGFSAGDVFRISHGVYPALDAGRK
jgi:hypothetical protein